MKERFASRFKSLRKQCGFTQEQLADSFGVTTQAVSKWETGASYPDIELLPKIAAFFGITLDDLLNKETDPEPALGEMRDRCSEAEAGIEDGCVDHNCETDIDNMIEREIEREIEKQIEQQIASSISENMQRAYSGIWSTASGNGSDTHSERTDASNDECVHNPYAGITFNELPNDGVIRVVWCIGNRIVEASEIGDSLKIAVDPASKIKKVEVFGSAAIEGDVSGDVVAHAGVNCGAIAGDVKSGASVSANGGIEGDVNAGGNVNGKGICGDVRAGGNVSCAGVEGDVQAGGNINCEDIGGDARAGRDICCADIGGDVNAGCDVKCGDINGDVRAKSVFSKARDA